MIEEAAGRSPSTRLIGVDLVAPVPFAQRGNTLFRRGTHDEGNPARPCFRDPPVWSKVLAEQPQERSRLAHQADGLMDDVLGRGGTGRAILAEENDPLPRLHREAGEGK